MLNISPMKVHGNLLLLTLAFSGITCLQSGCKKEDPGNKINFGTVTDNDGNICKTVNIGAQTWMAEDLKSITYQNGDEIPFVSEQSVWKDLNSGAMCYYQTDTDDSGFGKLYNWYAVDDSRNICPAGWRVPDNDDWSKLSLEVGPDAGVKLKESSINYWAEWKYSNTNETGFTALPNGCRTEYAIENGSRNAAGWWSSTSEDDKSAWFIHLSINYVQIFDRPENKVWGIPVRCVKAD